MACGRARAPVSSHVSAQMMSERVEKCAFLRRLCKTSLYPARVPRSISMTLAIKSCKSNAIWFVIPGGTKLDGRYRYGLYR